MKQLTTLNIGANEFSGPIPSELDSLINMQYLDLSRNNFSGPMPKIHNLKMLRWLQFGFQQLEGELDTILGYHPELSILTIGGNRFSGHLSTTHFNSDAILNLSVNSNELTGMDDFSTLADSGRKSLFILIKEKSIQ